MGEESILGRISFQQEKLDRMELSEVELEKISKARNFLCVTGMGGYSIT